ncbi:PD-(D/E)XK nuclease superfamily protein [Candidatus Desulfarcum epimagneticum]|uniref:PD-(D/E)XK nuclease superfamily protein n=1 Tax=uncultured Desulfobacteraceae bacterium TaxID=218296 RepID=A0A484HJ55_9BACT|nr:PD-(D/E)XK nuclease superfamily protein [uncultured Desulfobacteraceae bacterium]
MKTIAYFIRLYKLDMTVGISDFKKIMEEGLYFVDKSLFIKEILDKKIDAFLLPRPRRFGKTINLTMLRWFFEIAENRQEQNARRKLFSGLAIEQESAFEEHFAKYPVIYLTFKNISNKSFEAASIKIKSLIAEEFARHDYLLESDALSESEKKKFANIISEEAELAIYEDSLKKLTKRLHEYHGQKPLVLIDEYDTPIHSAFHYGYYDDCVNFFKGFLGAGLKDNTDIFKSVITGILRIARESIFSELNNLSVFSIVSQRFSGQFGLTQKEVEKILDGYDLKNRIKDVEKWYDGYIFGETKIYNPWSIVNFVSRVEEGFKPYWINTSSNELIKDLIKNSSQSVKSQLNDLLKDNPVIMEINENISFESIEYDEISVYSFLLFCGYLKAFDKERKNHKDYFKLLIPNFEVKQNFETIILKWIKQSSFENDKLQMMLHALVTGDVETFEYILSMFVLETLSYFDTAGRNVEKVYQAFILGMLVNLSNEYDVTT